MSHETTYLVFRKEGESASGKTEIHSVNSRSSGAILGVIKWYGAWRQYCFFPANDTIFNRGCMEDINDYITMMSHARIRNLSVEEYLEARS